MGAGIEVRPVRVVDLERGDRWVRGPVPLGLGARLFPGVESGLPTRRPLACTSSAGTDVVVEALQLLRGELEQAVANAATRRGMANNAGTRNRPVRTRLPPFSWSYTVITLLCSSPRWLLRKTSYENGRGSALTARTAIGHGHPVDGGGAELDVRRWGLHGWPRARKCALFAILAVRDFSFGTGEAEVGPESKVRHKERTKSYSYAHVGDQWPRCNPAYPPTS